MCCTNREKHISVHFPQCSELEYPAAKGACPKTVRVGACVHKPSNRGRPPFLSFQGVLLGGDALEVKPGIDEMCPEEQVHGGADRAGERERNDVTAL